MTRVSPGRNPNRLRRVAVLLCVGVGVMAMVWFVTTDAFDGWFSWASRPEAKPARHEAITGGKVSDETQALIAPYQMHAFPVEPSNGAAMEASAPVSPPAEASLTPLLQQLIDGQRETRALLEILIKQRAPTTSSTTSRGKDASAAREAARKAYEERMQKAKEWKLPVLDAEPPKEVPGAVKRLKTPYSLAPSTLIPLITESRVSNETKGPFRAFVSRPVCDSATHSHVVLPQMATFLLELSGTSIAGDTRAAVQAHTLTFPNGQYITLTNAAVSDRAGTPGFGDQVDHHHLRTWLFGLFAAGLKSGSSIVAAGADGALNRVGGALATETASQGVRETRQFLRTDPTITIREGYEGTLYLRDELALAAPYPVESTGLLACGGPSGGS